MEMFFIVYVVYVLQFSLDNPTDGTKGVMDYQKCPDYRKRQKF